MEPIKYLTISLSLGSQILVQDELLLEVNHGEPWACKIKILWMAQLFA